MINEDRDRLFGVLHLLAEKSQLELENSFTESNELAIRELVTRFLIGCELPSVLNATSFAESVYELRENERAWSRRLGEAIIAAEDKLQEGDRKAAVLGLTIFVNQCPWLSLKEIAEIELQNFHRLSS